MDMRTGGHTTMRSLMVSLLFSLLGFVPPPYPTYAGMNESIRIGIKMIMERGERECEREQGRGGRVIYHLTLEIVRSAVLTS